VVGLVLNHPSDVVVVAPVSAAPLLLLLAAS
jgi:hypothetical protein